jgi:hypothetical protein
MALPGSGHGAAGCDRRAPSSAGIRASFQSASELGGKPVDYQIAAAVSLARLSA